MLQLCEAMKDGLLSVCMMADCAMVVHEKYVELVPNFLKSWWTKNGLE